MSFSFPGEEDGAMTTAANPRSSGWGYIFPKRLSEFFHKYVLFENVPESEIDTWKREYLFLVKKISLANGGKQLVLKSPPNTARIRVLLSLFPNAKFIMIHRNPYDVYASNKRFWKVVYSFYALGKPDALNQNQLILDLYADLAHRYLADKHFIPKGQLIELSYEDFIQKPMHNIRLVYETLHLNNFENCAHIMKKYVDRQKNYVRLTHDLPPDERKLVAEKLEPFFKYWKYA